jgi:urease accessory protein
LSPILINPASLDQAYLRQLRLLQLASSTLPVGAYSYSEGLEFLTECGSIGSAAALQDWIEQELRYGAIRVEAGIMLRAYRSALQHDDAKLLFWNHWWSAAREAEELRLQSWQMGRSLLQLFLSLADDVSNDVNRSWSALQALESQHCNFAIAFGVVAAAWQLEPATALLGYLQCWATNLTAAGIKLIPLGQTAGQQILQSLQPLTVSVAQDLLQQPDEALESCGWGLTLACMAHETQYSRLFRS